MVATLGVQQLAEILVLAACRLEIEDEVLDRETEIVERVLKFAHGLLHAGMPVAGVLRDLLKLLTRRGRQSVELLHQVRQFRLEVLLVHGNPLRSGLVLSNRRAKVSRRKETYQPPCPGS